MRDGASMVKRRKRRLQYSIVMTNHLKPSHSYNSRACERIPVTWLDSCLEFSGDWEPRVRSDMITPPESKWSVLCCLSTCTIDSLKLPQQWQQIIQNICVCVWCLCVCIPEHWEFKRSTVNLVKTQHPQCLFMSDLVTLRHLCVYFKWLLTGDEKVFM